MTMNRAKSQKINKTHAIVHMASIDVKIIRIDKKQLTQSVFRQIEDRSIFDFDGNLIGVPWGRVNYAYDKTPKWASYYLVWRHINTIYKMPMVSVNGETKRYPAEEFDWWGCKHCDSERSAITARDTCNLMVLESKGLDKCCSCGRRTGKCTGIEYLPKWLGFFTYLQQWDLYDHCNDKDADINEELTDCYNNFTTAIVQFESLDLLFIAV